MSTFCTRDGNDLLRLIAGNNVDWDELQLAWNDCLTVFAWRCLPGDWEHLLADVWTNVRLSVSKWRPGVDKDEHGHVIPRALTLNYVKTCIRNLAARKRKAQEGPLGHPVISLDKTTATQGDADADKESLASSILAKKDHGGFPEKKLLELVEVLELKLNPVSDNKKSVHDSLGALLEDRLLLNKGVSLLIKFAQPPLSPEEEDVYVRRWQREESFLQISQNLQPTDQPAANWAANRFYAAMKKVIAGLRALNIDDMLVD